MSKSNLLAASNARLNSDSPNPFIKDEAKIYVVEALPAIKDVSDTVHKETILGNGKRSIIGAEALDFHALEEEFVEIPLEEFGGSVVGEEDIESTIEESLDEAVKNINENSFSSSVIMDHSHKPHEVTSDLSQIPEVIDDFIRNYLSNRGLNKSLDTFQNEWFEFKQTGRLTAEDVTDVPDVYQQNQKLTESIQRLKNDVSNYKDIASKAKATFQKLRKERDFHRMHHKRVVQEKNKLINDIKRMKEHYQDYEPAMKQLQQKYDASMKEKMVLRLEKEKLAAKIAGMERDAVAAAAVKAAAARRKAAAGTNKVGGAAEKLPDVPDYHLTGSKKGARELPKDERLNPYLKADIPTPHLGGLRQIGKVQAHGAAVTCVKFHPRKDIFATVSDDKTWKMYTLPTADLVMSGTGHHDWIGECDFSPRGSHLATASGDGTIKLWDFSKGSVVATLTDHGLPVWTCEWHWSGEYVASGSMDKTIKLWDATTGKCKQTLRGHGDSVNRLTWVPYTNTLFSASADKTVSLWDARTGTVTSTLFGHLNSVSSCAVSLRGDQFLTSDLSGHIKWWDMRMMAEKGSYQFSGVVVHNITLDPAGTTLVTAMGDGSVRFLDLTTGAPGLTTRKESIVSAAGTDGAQWAAFDGSAKYFVVAGTDGACQIYEN